MNLVKRHSLYFLFLYFALNKDFTLKVEIRDYHLSYFILIQNYLLQEREYGWAVAVPLLELLMLDGASHLNVPAPLGDPLNLLVLGLVAFISFSGAQSSNPS